MMLYLDTSSLVKLYIEEPFSDEVRRWVQDATTLVSSCVAYPETLSAFARRHRDRDLDDAGFHRVVQGFQRDWEAFAVVQVQESLAGQMAMKHVIRGFDAVHLAAALVIRDSVPTLAFTSFDGRLNQAATQEGLTVLVP
jgi:predicted nucleic acid-binding protein